MQKKILSGSDALSKYEEIKGKGLLLFEAIVGSQAYGTALPTSDIDKKFIYIDTLEDLLSDNGTEQLNITDDYVGYELGRYFELLLKQSPNMHELIWSPEDCIIHCNQLFKDLIISERSKFLSKNIRYSFGEYASSQIEKARGLNKKIVNPIEKERKTPLDFCWVPWSQEGKEVGSVPVKEWLEYNGLRQEYCGLSSIDHMKYNHYLFYDFPAHLKEFDFINSLEEFLYLLSDNYYQNSLESYSQFYNRIKYLDNLNYKGIVQKETSNDISLSSIPKGQKPLITMFFNLEGYTKYCKDYKEYWDWVEKRNEVRYQTNILHGAQYDSKNLSHCHRLLDTCIEALRENVINVRRNNKEKLLQIRSGVYSYELLISEAQEKIEQIKRLYETSTLPEIIDSTLIFKLLLVFRNKFYNLNLDV